MAQKKYRGTSVKRKTLVEIYGASELLNSIEKAGGNVDEAIKKCVDRTLKIVGDDMQKFMEQHRETGDTYQSYQQTPASKGDVEIGGAKYKIKNGVSGTVGYDIQKGGLPAIFLDVGTTARENGTPRREGHYFRYYAVENNTAQIQAIQQETLNEILKELKK